MPYMHSPFKAYGQISSTFEDVDDANVTAGRVFKPSRTVALYELTPKKTLCHEN